MRLNETEFKVSNRDLSFLTLCEIKGFTNQLLEETKQLMAENEHKDISSLEDITCDLKTFVELIAHKIESLDQIKGRYGEGFLKT